MTSQVIKSAVWIVAVVACVPGRMAAARAAEPSLEYNRDVRPILAEACLACHGPDSAARKADLRLDRREVAVDMGAIAPGDPDASEMIRRILSEDETERMPPPETKKTLTQAQKDTLVRWISAGAEYQPHWSLIAPVRPEPPTVGNAWWARNAIDRFIAARLEAAGLAPAPEADRRTLARRLSLDLTGLPPTPAVVEEFVNDTAPDAYERLVDRLLATPQWGEHRARYWLDAARYADTNGIHFDNYREMWSYREWVISAFNRNMPFDQFTIENLAGDLLPEATMDQKIGSGFNRCNMTTNEGGAINEEYLVLYARDRVETTSLVFMGLTAGCAVCHDHKFDPLTQKEFYELAAFFNNTTQAAMDGNVKDTPPVIATPLAKDRARWAELTKLVPVARAKLDARKAEARPEFDTWVAAAKPEEYGPKIPADGLELLVPLNDGGDSLKYALRGKEASTPRPATAEWRPGRLSAQAAYLNQGALLELPDAGDFEGDHAYSCAAWIKLPANDGGGAVLARMDESQAFRGWDMWIEARRIGGHLINKFPDNAIKILTREQLPADAWVHVAVVYDGSRKAAGFKVYVNGKAQATDVLSDTLTETTRTTVPLKVGQRHTSSPLSGVTLEDVRVYDRALSDGEASSLATAALFATLARPPEKRAAADVDALFEWWLVNLDEERQVVAGEYDALAREQADIQARGTISHIMQEKPEAPMAFVLNRGEYDQRRDQVAPATPAFLPPFPADLPRNRLGFAQWLMRPEHPLTARVAVNRFWQELFGTGLVKTAGDFGITGDLPSHPELLDWLAVEFRESGWDVKQLFKLMVTSSAYRQAATVTPEKIEKDADNRLVSRGPRFRMDAEMIRDYALAASGLLSAKIGGPSVKPYQPPGVWDAVAMIGSNTRDYQQDAGEALYRRSLYTFWKRAAPPASMEVFNAPNRENCVVCRERTNTPLQALVTLNDPQFVEAARRLAGNALREGGGDFHSRVKFVAERLLARELSKEEESIVKTSFDQLANHYSANADDAKQVIDVGDSNADVKLPAGDLAAWTMTVNALMNLDEVVNK